MPQMGVSVSEGTITKWLKQVGEPIAQDEPLLEISTDKVDTEVPSPGEGVVSQILVAGGRDRRRRHRARDDRARRVRARRARRRDPLPQAEPAPAAEPAAPRAGRAASPSAAHARAAPSRHRLRPRSAAAHRPPRPAAGNGKSFVSPVVARIAAEHGVDPASVPGTGTGGRVTKKDILAFIESGAAQAPAARGRRTHRQPPEAPAAQPVAAPAPQPAPPPRHPPPPPRAGPASRLRPPRPPAPAPRSRLPPAAPGGAGSSAAELGSRARSIEPMTPCGAASPSTCAARSTPRRT